MNAHGDDRTGKSIPVVLYGKAGCHLCEEALEVLWKVQKDRPFELTIIDIRRDQAIYDRMIETIPVVEVDAKFSEFRVDETAFRNKLKELNQ